jgi:hypothetical protein
MVIGSRQPVVGIIARLGIVPENNSFLLE